MFIALESLSGYIVFPEIDYAASKTQDPGKFSVYLRTDHMDHGVLAVEQWERAPGLEPSGHWAPDALFEFKYNKRTPASTNRTQELQLQSRDSFKCGGTGEGAMEEFVCCLRHVPTAARSVTGVPEIQFVKCSDVPDEDPDVCSSAACPELATQWCLVGLPNPSGDEGPLVLRPREMIACNASSGLINCDHCEYKADDPNDPLQYLTAPERLAIMAYSGPVVLREVGDRAVDGFLATTDPANDPYANSPPPLQGGPGVDHTSDDDPAGGMPAGVPANWTHGMAAPADVPLDANGNPAVAGPAIPAAVAEVTGWEGRLEFVGFDDPRFPAAASTAGA